MFVPSISLPETHVTDTCVAYQSARGVKAQALSDLHALCMPLLQPITLCSPAPPLVEALAMEARTAAAPNMAKTAAPRRASNDINHGSGRDHVETMKSVVFMPSWSIGAGYIGTTLSEERTGLSEYFFWYYHPGFWN